MRRIATYTISVALIALAVVIAAGQPAGWDWALMGGLLGLALLASYTQSSWFGFADVSVSYVPLVVCAIVLGPLPTLLLVLALEICELPLERRRKGGKPYTFSSFFVSMAVTAWPLVLGALLFTTLASVSFVGALAATGIVVVIVNIALGVTLVALRDNSNWLDKLKPSFALSYATAATIVLTSASLLFYQQLGYVALASLVVAVVIGSRMVKAAAVEHHHAKLVRRATTCLILAFPPVPSYERTNSYSHTALQLATIMGWGPQRRAHAYTLARLYGAVGSEQADDLLERLDGADETKLAKTLPGYNVDEISVEQLVEAAAALVDYIHICRCNGILDRDRLAGLFEYHIWTTEELADKILPLERSTGRLRLAWQQAIVKPPRVPSAIQTVVKQEFLDWLCEEKVKRDFKRRLPIALRRALRPVLAAE